MSTYSTNEIMDNKHKCLGGTKRCGVYKITNTQNDKIYILVEEGFLQRVDVLLCQVIFA